METLPTRIIAKIVLITVLVCSFIPRLHRIGPFALHTAASGLEHTARVADWMSGYSHHHHVEDDDG